MNPTNPDRSTMPTLEDHHKDAVRYPACNCGTIWRQRGNLTGHCTKCHETFEGISLFDRHQHTGPDGRTICTNPADITLGKAETHLEFIDGVWRGPRMSDAAKARMKAIRHPEASAAPKASETAAPPAIRAASAPTVH